MHYIISSTFAAFSISENSQFQLFVVIDLPPFFFVVARGKLVFLFLFFLQMEGILESGLVVEAQSRNVEIITHGFFPLLFATSKIEI
jgi:hypothetical protein